MILQTLWLEHLFLDRRGRSRVRCAMPCVGFAMLWLQTSKVACGLWPSLDGRHEPLFVRAEVVAEQLAIAHDGDDCHGRWHGMARTTRSTSPASASTRSCSSNMPRRSTSALASRTGSAARSAVVHGMSEPARTLSDGDFA